MTESEFYMICFYRLGFSEWMPYPEFVHRYRNAMHKKFKEGEREEKPTILRAEA